MGGRHQHQEPPGGGGVLCRHLHNPDERKPDVRADQEVLGKLPDGADDDRGVRRGQRNVRAGGARHRFAIGRGECEVPGMGGKRPGRDDPLV